MRQARWRGQVEVGESGNRGLYGPLEGLLVMSAVRLPQFPMGDTGLSAFPRAVDGSVFLPDDSIYFSDVCD